MGRLIRIILVDDHPVVRAGMEATLTKTGGFLVVGQASAPDDALVVLANERGAGRRVDVILCDLFFDGRPLGFDLLTELAADPSSPPIVMFSQFASDSLYRTAVEQGAAGYLSKDAPLTEIARALRGAAAGHSSLPLAAMRASRQAPESPKARDRLIISAVAHGATNSEIAVEMNLALKTVEGRLSRMYRSYGVVSRAELVALALSDGWISSQENVR